MAATKGQPAPKPSQLTAPVPGKEEAMTADSFLADFDAPEMQSNASSTANDFVASMEGPTEAEFAPEPGFLQANVEQFQNLGDRVMYGLSANNNEAMAKLQQKYGPQNVTMRKGEIWFRKNAMDKMKRIDPDQFEVFADLIPDGARNIIMEAVMLPAEIGGGMAAGPAGAAAGRAASVPMATSVAEGVNRLAGIPQDPERNVNQEAMIGTAVEAFLPAVGGKLVNMVSKRLPGTAAYNAAKEAAKKEVVALSNQSQAVLESAKRLEDEGFQNGLNLFQLQPDSPKVKGLINTVSDSDPFHKKQMEMAQDYEAALVNTLYEIKRKVNPKGPVSGGKISSDIKGAITSLDKKEAEAIGQYRAKAMAKLGNAKQQLPAQTSDDVVALMDEMGFQRKAREMKTVTRPGSFSGAAERGAVSVPQTKYSYNFIPPKDIRSIEGRLGLTEGQTRAMVNALNEYGQYMSKGNEARLSDLEQLINRLGPMTQKLRGTPGGAHLGKVVGDLRQHRRQIIGETLDKGSFEDVAFNTAMDDFSLIRRNVDDLSAVLDGDLSSDAVVKYFFDQTKSPERVKALKSILGEDSHQWGALKEKFVDRMLTDYGGKADSITRFNSGKFLDDMTKKYGDEIMKDVFPDKKSLQKVKDLLTYGQRFEATTIGVRPENLAGKKAEAASDALAGATFGVKFKMLNGVMKLLRLDNGKENALMELYNRDGFHKYIANYKGPGNKSEIAKKVEYMLMQYNAARAAHKQTAAVMDIGKDLTKRGARAEIRQESSVRD